MTGFFFYLPLFAVPVVFAVVERFLLLTFATSAVVKAVLPLGGPRFVPPSSGPRLATRTIGWDERSEPQHGRLSKEARMPGHGERMLFAPVKLAAP
jgi:hypothetical protein